MVNFEAEFWNPSVTTNAIIFSMHKNILSVLLVKRGDGNGWTLPGGCIQEGESLDDCLRRELRQETGIEVPYLAHFGIYSEPKRDPRRQTISVAYVTAHPSGKLKLHADTDVIDVGWFDVCDLPALAFDHARICSDGIKYAQAQIEQHPSIVFAFLQAEFTLTELQEVYAALGGKKFSPENKRNFRLWVSKFCNGAGMVVETGNYRTGLHRPAKLYKPNPLIPFGQCMEASLSNS